MNQIKRFFKEEQGQGMTEYGLVLGFVGAAVVAALVFFRDDISGIFENLVEDIFPDNFNS